MIIDDVPIEIEVKDFSEEMEKKIIQFACVMNVSAEYTIKEI